MRGHGTGPRPRCQRVSAAVTNSLPSRGGDGIVRVVAPVGSAMARERSVLAMMRLSKRLAGLVLLTIMLPTLVSCAPGPAPSAPAATSAPAAPAAAPTAPPTFQP